MWELSGEAVPRFAVPRSISAYLSHATVDKIVLVSQAPASNLSLGPHATVVKIVILDPKPRSRAMGMSSGRDLGLVLVL